MFSSEPIQHFHMIVCQHKMFFFLKSKASKDLGKGVYSYFTHLKIKSLDVPAFKEILLKIFNFAYEISDHHLPNPFVSFS